MVDLFLLYMIRHDTISFRTLYYLVNAYVRRTLGQDVEYYTVINNYWRILVRIQVDRCLLPVYGTITGTIVGDLRISLREGRVMNCATPMVIPASPYVEVDSLETS